jgi:ribulose-phosphate 3-epimerase
VTELSVGILTADLLRLGDEIESVASVGVNRLHVDVMDGVFCPGITVGPAFVRALPDALHKDVHLMIDEPLGKVDAFVAAGADTLTFHLEATRHPHRVLQELAGRGVIRGVAINPGTSLSAVEPLLDELELILVLSVNPGWSGQRFAERTFERLELAKRMAAGRDIQVGVDGGVTRANVDRVIESGVDVIVAGSSIFDGLDAAANARFMLGATTQPVGSAS